MFAHAGGLLLGGTWDRDVWDTKMSDADTARILNSHHRFFEGFRCSA